MRIFASSLLDALRRAIRNRLVNRGCLPLVDAICVATLLCLQGCSIAPPVGEATNTLPSAGAVDKINWPERYRPENAAFFVTSEIDIKAQPQVVWDIVVQAESWPRWYVGASDVKVIGSSTGTVGADSKFSWQTMGQQFTSEVKEFKPPFRLSWESRKSTIQGYHAWLLIPQPDGSTRVVSDEAMNGFLAYMQKIFLPNKLRDLHDVWLAEIKKIAEAKPK
jgi:uncharacterized protein YndB with AHSA1/START domain